MRPFRFLAAAAEGITTAREITETARRAESMGFAGLVLPDHLVDQHAPIPLLAAVAAATRAAPDRHVRAEQRAAAPGRARAGPGHARRALGGPTRRRHRRRLEPAGVRRDRAAVSAGRSADLRARRGDHGAQGLLRRRRVLVRRRALHDHRTRRAAQAGAAAASAVLHRRRRSEVAHASRAGSRHHRALAADDAGRPDARRAPTRAASPPRRPRRRFPGYARRRAIDSTPSS